ncbi:hypothetical protein DPMN_087588 [Dreissena polymorpha]|uniref:Uncharacterized protein n=1 Tax=Dreissena polymorpha TaxID=45954 RepID=A0A9D4QVQ9_DREPO|nr:hypothetical protein DPMN_087588 [Dreissena polymorpha]
MLVGILGAKARYIGQRDIPVRDISAQNINGTNLPTKFHKDLKINVASRALTRKNAPPLAAIVLTIFYYSHVLKNAPPLGSHVFQANIIIFKLIQDIIKTNLLTKSTKTIFKLIQDIIGTILLTKFHDDRKINVTSRVLTRKNAPPTWWPCFSTNRYHF